MILPNPCPCLPLEVGVKVIAVVGAAMSGVGLIFCVLVLAGTDSLLSYPDPRLMELGLSLGKAEMIISLLLLILEIVLCVLLFWGAHKKIIWMCWTWIGSTVLDVLYNFIITVSYVGKRRDARSTVADVIVLFFLIVISIYVLWVVFSFIMRLRRIARISQQQQQAPEEVVSTGFEVRSQSPSSYNALEAAGDGPSTQQL